MSDKLYVKIDEQNGERNPLRIENDCDDILRMRRYRKGYAIGDHVIDDDGNEGIVCIKWNDGDISHQEDVAHPNPRKV